MVTLYKELSMALPLWAFRFTKFCFPSRFFLARCTRIPILGHLIRFVAFHKDRIFYLPRNRVVEMNCSVDLPEEHPIPTQIVEHFIRKAKYHWIMERCICRDSAGCQDYPVDLGCMFMGEAVLGIHSKLGRLVSRGEAFTHVKKCQEAGLVHLIGRNKLDTLWLGISPGKKLLTVCHCCPCCCLWKMLPDLKASVGRRITRLPGVNVVVTDRCTGCGICTDEVCFVKAIQVNGDRAVISGECRGCGRCVEMCPEKAIKIEYSGESSIQCVVDALEGLVDVA